MMTDFFFYYEFVGDDYLFHVWPLSKKAQLAIQTVVGSRFLITNEHPLMPRLDPYDTSNSHIIDGLRRYQIFVQDDDIEWLIDNFVKTTELNGIELDFVDMSAIMAMKLMT